MFIGLFVRENIQLNINENNSFIILGHENEMMQVLLNIFNNSKDAFNDKKEMENKIINCSFKIQNNTGVIKIEDNAGGIPTELLPEKIFENYVSTKGDKGTGIGLNISKSIIEKKFSGNISAKNVKNGAQFTIELPIKS